MAVSDRLRCPLLRCGEQFDDHETMLRHLSSCQHLDAGEYLCYECMKVEKFNDGKCKCCLGHQTKRRRIINAAKKVFSTLGHKSRKDGPYESLHDGFAILPPPSYESLDLDQQTLLPLHSEISGTPINEIDGEPVLPVELGSVNYEPQNDQPQPFVENSTSLSVISPFIKPHPPFHHLHNIQTQSGSRPSLTLDTHNTIQPNKVARTTYLSPSSSFRSANSSQHIISPVSAGSGMWTYGSTIDTTLASPITPFSSDVESSSLSRENSCKFPKDHPIPSLLLDWDTNSNKANVPSEMELAQSSDDYVVHNVSELPGDIPLDMPVPRTWCNDPMLFSFEDKESYSWSSRIDTEVNVLFAGDNVHLDIEDEAFSNDTKSLVSNTWDTLKEQMICSLSNSQHVNNHLARQLGSLSLLEVALKGLACLQSILGGVDPTDPIDYLCFVHVIYAFSLVIHEEDAATRVSGLFKQALAYQGFMTAIDRNAYATVVAAIWEPTISEESNSLLGGSSSLKGKGPELRANSEIPFQFDQLINVAQNFLDGELHKLLGRSLLCGMAYTVVAAPCSFRCL